MNICELPSVYHKIPQKIILFSSDHKHLLLAKRQGEKDLDGIYTLVGGKIEWEDGDIVKGLKREKDEEIGKNVRIKINPKISKNTYFRLHDGSYAFLPHYYAVHVSGNIELSSEYSDYKWIKVSELTEFEPMVSNIPDIASWALDFRKLLERQMFEI